MDEQKLFEMINKHFDEEELRDLCFYLKIDFENLRSDRKYGKVRELILHCIRADCLEELAEVCQKFRPNVDWTEFTAHDGIASSIQEVTDHDELPPIVQVHEYSGDWEIETFFELWRGVRLGKGDQVYFQGKAFLLIEADGKRGCGTQNGKLKISIGNYSATYQIFNRIISVDITDDKVLHLYVEVIDRERIDEKGEPGDPRFREGLRDLEFKLDLYPIMGEPDKLKGMHTYWEEDKIIQVAEENYRKLHLQTSS